MVGEFRWWQEERSDCPRMDRHDCGRLRVPKLRGMGWGMSNRIQSWIYGGGFQGFAAQKRMNEVVIGVLIFGASEIILGTARMPVRESEWRFRRPKRLVQHAQTTLCCTIDLNLKDSLHTSDYNLDVSPTRPANAVNCLVS